MREGSSRRPLAPIPTQEFRTQPYKKSSLRTVHTQEMVYESDSVAAF